MSEPQKIKRDEFIKLALLSGAAFYFNSCQSGNNKVEPVAKVNDSIVKDTISAKLIESDS